MLQETMRALVLVAEAVLEGELGQLEAQELRALRTILKRASRAQAGTPPEVLDATASGKPMPPPEK